MTKRDDYPGSRVPRKELHKRLAWAYQLAARLLMSDKDPEEARLEMETVLLDFLSDPSTADTTRLRNAARAFRSVQRVTWTTSDGTTVTTSPPPGRMPDDYIAEINDSLRRDGLSVSPAASACECERVNPWFSVLPPPCPTHNPQTSTTTVTWGTNT